MFPSPEAAAHYLAAMIDGEGHVANKTYTRSNGSPQYNRYVSIVNTDRDLIDACAEACNVLDIGYRVHDRDRKGDAQTMARKHQWALVIGTRDGLEKVAAAVPLRCAAKRSAVEAAAAGFRAEPRYDEAARLYAELGSYRAVAAELGIPASTAQLWITKAGVEKRGPGRPKGRAWSQEERAATMAGRAAARERREAG